MSRLSLRVAMSAVLFGAINLAAHADGTPVGSTPPSTSTAPTYITVGDIVGEIVKVDSKQVTVRVQWYTQAPPKNSNNNSRHYGNWHRGTSGRSSQAMHQHMQFMQQQLARQRTAANGKPQEHHQDYVMDFTTDATARIQHLPQKLDENGKKVYYTPDEHQKLKGNPILPGFKADLTDLKVGQLVEAHVVRTPGSEKTKDKSDDHLVRWALILNEQHVGKATTSTTTPKKKN